MSIELALREEILNVFGMIYDNINGRTYPSVLRNLLVKKEGNTYWISRKLEINLTEDVNIINCNGTRAN